MNQKKHLKLRIFAPSIFCFFAFIFTPMSTNAQENLSYQLPDQTIVDLIDAMPTPAVSISPKGDWMLMLYRPNLPSLEEVAEEELRLAGIRINPRTNSSSRAFYYNNLKVKPVGTGEELSFTGLPENLKIENVSWAPDGSKIAFTLTKEDGLELWVAELESRKARRMAIAVINDAIPGLPYRWFSDGNNILFKRIPE